MKQLISFPFFYTGLKKSVQTEVEKPFPYLLARCPSSGQQLMYSETRLEDMIAWNKKECEVNGVTILDKIRFFKGKRVFFAAWNRFLKNTANFIV